MAVADLIREIEIRRADRLERQREVYPKNNPTASDLGPCARETALAILHWQERPPVPADLLARFDRGRVIEDTVIRELGSLGLYVRVERKPFEIRDRDGRRLLMRGKIDGFIEYEKAEYPMEVKSIDPLIYKRIASVDDFARYGTLGKWPRQLQAYLYANGLPEGFFLLDDCLGHWKLLPVTLDYGVMEDVLQQVACAVVAVERVRFGVPEDEALPDYHSDIAVCRRCWCYGRVCQPPNLSPGEGLRIIEDPTTELLLARREELQASAREYDRIDKHIKATFREVPEAVCGPFLIRGKVQPRNYKAQPAHTVNTWITDIARLAPDPPPVTSDEEDVETSSTP